MGGRNWDELLDEINPDANRLLVIPANERRKRARKSAARRRELGITFEERTIPGTTCAKHIMLDEENE